MPPATPAPPDVRSVDARIAHAAIAGYPITTRERLRRAGNAPKSTARRIGDGRLWEIWAPVLLIGVRPAEVTYLQVCAAALTSVGSEAALDGTCALERRGLWDRHDGSIHVTSDRSHAPIRFQVPAAWRAQDVWRKRGRVLDIRFTQSTRPTVARAEVIDGLRTRAAVDALVRAASTLTPHQLAYVIKRGEYSRQLTLADVEGVIEHASGGRGMGALRRAVALRHSGSAGTKSRSEDVALPHVSRTFGEPVVNVRGIAGIPTHEPDFCWPGERRIVEIDGGHHVDDPAQREADLLNDELLRAAGWVVVRIPWARVWADMPGVMSTIRAAFEAGQLTSPAGWPSSAR